MTSTVPELPPGERITGNQRATLRGQMVTEYAKGTPIRDIAEQCGRSYGFVHRVLVESRVEFRSRGGKHRKREDES